jgi:hypothetical protein
VHLVAAQERQRALSLWLQHVTGHPRLATFPALATFCGGGPGAALPAAWAAALVHTWSDGSPAAAAVDASAPGPPQAERVAQWSRAVAEAELKQLAAAVAALARPLERCYEASKQLERAAHGSASGLESFGTSAARVSGAVVGGRTRLGASSGEGVSAEARLLAAAGEAAAAAGVAGLQASEALLKGCVEPLRFQARCAVGSAQAVVETARRRKGSGLEEVANAHAALRGAAPFYSVCSFSPSDIFLSLSISLSLSARFASQCRWRPACASSGGSWRASAARAWP